MKTLRALRSEGMAVVGGQAEGQAAVVPECLDEGFVIWAFPSFFGSGCRTNPGSAMVQFAVGCS